MEKYINKILNIDCLDGLKNLDDNSIDMSLTSPFMGSGTTAKMSLINERKFIGFEISKEYTLMANERIRPYL